MNIKIHHIGITISLLLQFKIKFIVILNGDFIALYKLQISKLFFVLVNSSGLIIYRNLYIVERHSDDINQDNNNILVLFITISYITYIYIYLYFILI